MKNKRIRIVILGASEIAFRRFLPALMKDRRFQYVGVAYYRQSDKTKVKNFKKKYGGEIIKGFENVFSRKDVDAIYVPQPPALHYKFGKKVLLNHKHLFMEKPFTTKIDNTKTLLKIARINDLGCVENYMFRFHKQIKSFIRYSNDGTIGKLKKYEVKFCFPLRNKSDFRYLKKIGGGALLDCGGYTIMLSDILTSQKGKLFIKKPIYEKGYEVDMHGSGKVVNCSLTSYFYFGMNDEYCCRAIAYGTKYQLVANRILTAPNDFDVVFELKDYSERCIKTIKIGRDDSFLKSLNNFYNCIMDIKGAREANNNSILRQAVLLNQALKKGNY